MKVKIIGGQGVWMRVSVGMSDLRDYTPVSLNKRNYNALFVCSMFVVMAEQLVRASSGIGELFDQS